MQRRHFLSLLSTLLMGLMTQSHAASATTAALAGNPKRIVVIGAGLAGLAAARELQSKGHAVILVEGRDRIGGRIWTSTRWPDMPLDLGATWIHGVKGNPLTTLAKNTGAKLLSTHYESSLTYNTAGKPLSKAEEQRLDHLRKQFSQSLKKAQEREQDVSLRQLANELADRLAASAETRRYLDFILSGSIEQEYAGSADELSAHWYDNANTFPGKDALFVDGFHTLTNHLAQNLTIETNQSVHEIHWDQRPLRIVTDKTEFTADQIVVTLPLGVLQAGSVRFMPELPTAKRQAITGLGMGVLNKCYLHFAKAFWPTNVDWLEYIPDRHGEWTEWVSFMRTANLPILLGFNAAKQGRTIEAWPDEQIVSSAMQTLHTLYGKDIPEPLDYQITRWASDPFARGSYSFNPTGTLPEMRTELARPLDNKLFFAGEATDSDYFSTAHGAFLSGLRASREIMAV